MVKAERSNYYDLGVQQKISRELTVGIDSYYKQATDLIDEGQFGAPIILTPFNYAHGQVYGVEFTGNYTVRSLRFVCQLRGAARDRQGHRFRTVQFRSRTIWRTSRIITFIWIMSSRYTASAGAAYTWQNTRFSGDVLIGSGLRRDLDLPDGSTIPNGAHLPYYRQVNLGVSHDFDREGVRGLSARFDVINAFDQKYEIRDGTGVGVGAPQFGPRRGFFVGASYSF